MPRATAHGNWETYLKERNLLIFAINLGFASIHDLNSPSRIQLPSFFQSPFQTLHMSLYVFETDR
jgi:hypothetical protein